MSNPFDWLRLIRLALALLVFVVSVASGIPLGSQPGQADAFGMLTRLVGNVADLAETATSGSAGGEVLDEIVDEPLAAVVPPGGVVPETPGDAGGAGGVLGGGESLGPDGGAVTPVASGPSPAPVESPPDEPATEVPQPTVTAAANPGSPALPSPSPALARPSPSPSPSVAPTATVPPTPTPAPDVIRLDEPILRFLPEINAAANATGVPASILAAIVRVESNGDPNLIANGSRIGLTGVSAAGLANQGIAQSAWNDPAANLLAGAGTLAGLFGSTGSWDAALDAYFGEPCDLSGVCAGEYRYAVQAWSNYYSGAVSNPGGGGFALLPQTWTAPTVAPYQGASPRPIPLPPGVAAPTPTPQPTEVSTSTVPPTDTPEVSDLTEAPTETAVPPTEPPTPTTAPTSTPSSTVAP